MDLDLVRVECDVIAESATQLIPFIYSELRNFEVHFKKSACLSLQNECPVCTEQGECPYKMIFGQKLSSDPEIVRLHQKPPLPFALYIEERSRDLSTSALSVGLVVIGTAVNYMDYFYPALLGMVETAVCSVLNSDRYLLNFYTLDYQGVRLEVSRDTSFSDGVMLLSGHHILHESVHSDSIRISLKSPMRLLCHGSILHLFDFAAFFRSQMRRCSSLCAYYGAGEMELDYAQLSDLAQNVAVFDDNIRYSQPWWSKRLNKAGLTGSAECSGLGVAMSALLTLGSFFNAGKGAAFGSGQYRVEAL